MGDLQLQMVALPPGSKEYRDVIKKFSIFSNQNVISVCFMNETASICSVF